MWNIELSVRKEQKDAKASGNDLAASTNANKLKLFF